MRKIGSVLILVYCIMFFGCAINPFPTRKNPELFNDFMSKKGKIAVIWRVVEVDKDAEPTAQFYSSVMSKIMNRNLVNRLKKEKISPLVKKYYLNLFSNYFSSEGFEVKIIEKNYGGWKLFMPLKKFIKIAGEDLNTDYIMLIQIYRFGVVRDSYALIPTSQPKGITGLFCYLYKTSDNENIVFHHAGQVIPVEGEWDEPPEYKNLMKAVEISFEKTIDDCFVTFFNRIP